jgi:hypothetical protein
VDNSDYYFRSTRVEWAHEVLLSLNIGFALILAIVAFTYSGGGHGSSASYFLMPGERLFSYSASQVNQMLGFGRGDNVGREITSLAFVAIVATTVLLVFRLIRDTRASETALGPVGGGIVVALLPVLLLYVRQATWPPADTYTFWRSAEFSVAVIKLGLVFAFLFLTRHKNISIWWSAFVLAVYYCSWILLPWSVPLWSLRLLFLVFPLSGFAWLLYIHATHPERHSPSSIISGHLAPRV